MSATVEDHKQEEKGTVLPSATGPAFTRDGDEVGTERLTGGTTPDASLYDNTLTAARQKAIADIQALQEKVNEIKAHASARGEQPPDIDMSALSQDPNALSGQDLALLQQQLDKVEQSVRHEQGRQLQQSVGEAVGMAAGMAAVLGAVGGASEGVLAAVGVTGGKNVSEGQLFNGVDHGLAAMGLKQQKGQQLPDLA